MSKKAALAIGGTLAATLGIGWLIRKAAAKPIVPVTITANPIRTILLVDGQEIETPTKLNLSPGQHTFIAVPKSPDLVVLYGFDRWTINGKTVSYNTKITPIITAPALITAQYMIAESGRYPIITSA
jgi:hypothetical protein